MTHVQTQTEMTETELLLTRKLPAPPERVWQAWTDPKQLVQWFGGECGINQGAELDVRVGGKLRVRSKGRESGLMLELRGTYTEVDEPRKLAFTWNWIAEDGTPRLESETRVAIELEAVAGGTLCRIRHTGFAAEEAVKEHNFGWNSSLERLGGVLSTAAA